MVFAILYSGNYEAEFRVVMKVQDLLVPVIVLHIRLVMNRRRVIVDR